MMTALGLLIGLGAGAVGSIGKYYITRNLETKPPSGFLLASLIRQIVNLVFLVLAWLAGRHLPYPLVPFLIGVGLGLTIPTIVLSGWAARKAKDQAKTNEGEPMIEKPSDDGI